MRTRELFAVAVALLTLSVGALGAPRYDIRAKVWADVLEEDESMPSETHVWTNSDTDGDGSNPNNWTNEVTTSLRNATYKWTISAHGIGNEYFCELAGGGDPSLNDPDAIDLNSVEKSEGTLGALALDEWGYGDSTAENGYNTVYVRLADDADPDGKGVDWVEKRRTRPDSLDTLVFNKEALGSVSIGADYTGIYFAMFITHPGYTGDIATTAAPWKSTCGTVIHRGSGTLSWENAPGSLGAPYTQTLYFIVDSDNQDDAAQIDGVVGLVGVGKGRVTIVSTATVGHVYTAYRSDPYSDAFISIEQTNTVVLVGCGGGIIECVSPVTTLAMHDGRFTQKAAATGIVNTIYQSGGYAVYNYYSAGGFAYLYLLGGTFDFSQDARFKKIGLLVVWPGATFIPNEDTSITAGPSTITPPFGQLIPNQPF